MSLLLAQPRRERVEKEVEYVTCNLCGSDDAEEMFPSTLDGRTSAIPEIAAFSCTNSTYGIHLPIVRCRVCGLVYTNPRREARAIRDTYEQVVDITYLQESRGRELTFGRHLRALEAIVAPTNNRRLLDIGCYTGVFLEIAEGRGWQTWGVEPSHWAANEARQRGLRVFTGTLAEAGFSDGHFDVVTMWDVIEHLTVPLDDLREIHRVLKPWGLLCIHILDIESPIARIMGQRWPWLMEMHLYYFSQQTLFRMLEQGGFQPLEARTQGRFLRLGYLASRLEALKVPGMRAVRAILEWTGLNGVAMPVNLGDLFTAHARKAAGSPRCKASAS